MPPHRPVQTALAFAAAFALTAAAVQACGRAEDRSGAPPAKENAAMQTHGPDHSGDAVTLMKVRPQTDQTITVRSPAFTSGGVIPDRYSGYGDNLSPPLEWNMVPKAKAFAVVMEDPDAPRAEPFVHWTVWNIPEGTTSLPEGLPKKAALEQPQGAVQGKNSAGETGYFGPRPPDGHGVHHYHFQVFALSQPLGLKPDASFQELTSALKASTLAEGELIGLYERRTH